MKTVGDRIKERREQINMTQDELASKLGYKSRSSINKIEKESRGIPLDKIQDIAVILRTSPAYLMGWEEHKDQVSLESNIYDSITKTFGEDTSLLVNRYQQLNDDGRKKVDDYIDDLLEMPKYHR